MSASPSSSSPGITATVSAGGVVSVNGQQGAVALVLGVPSSPTGITGAAAITNVVSMNQAAYNALATKSSTTLYIVTPS
jgi:hypothetical protein